MKRCALVGLLALGLGMVTGCEWSSGGGASDFNDRFNFVNFSGVYRSFSGGSPVVTDFTGVIDEEIAVTEERIETGDGVSTVFSGVFDNEDVVPGSVTITGGGFTFVDPDGDGILTADPAGGGTIVYATGAYTIDTGASALEFSVPIVASYVFVRMGSDAGSGASGGIVIDTFTVIQEGNRLSIIDNLGATYEGFFGSIRSTGGFDQDDAAADEDVIGALVIPGADIIAQFSVSGVTAAGRGATITGVFTGAVSSDGRTLAERVMEGIFIEDGGSTGDVLAAAPSIGITTPILDIPGDPGSTAGTADTTDTLTAF